VVHRYAELALRQVADVTHRRDDLEVASQIFVDRLRLRRRLDHDQCLCHRTSNPNPQTRITNPESQITNPKSQIPNPESRIPSFHPSTFCQLARIARRPLAPPSPAFRTRTIAATRGQARGQNVRQSRPNRMAPQVEARRGLGPAVRPLRS